MISDSFIPIKDATNMMARGLVVKIVLSNKHIVGVARYSSS
jgi:hypothetical protein